MKNVHLLSTQAQAAYVPQSVHGLAFGQSASTNVSQYAAYVTVGVTGVVETPHVFFVVSQEHPSEIFLMQSPSDNNYAHVHDVILYV